MALSIYNLKNNRWREYYNPLRGLSIPKLASLLEAGERGENADLQWMYHYMERSDPMIFSIVQRRRAALLDSDWGVSHGMKPDSAPVLSEGVGRRADEVAARFVAA